MLDLLFWQGFVTGDSLALPAIVAGTALGAGILGTIFGLLDLDSRDGPTLVTAIGLGFSVTASLGFLGIAAIFVQHLPIG